MFQGACVAVRNECQKEEDEQHRGNAAMREYIEDDGAPRDQGCA